MVNFPKVVVVTGASAGVGRAAARAFAAGGADVALLARGKEGLEAASREAARFGRRGLVCPTDVAHHEQVEAAAERVEKELGPIEVWVNNAMTSVFSCFIEMTPAEYKRVTEVTYLGYVWGTMAALKRMLPRNQGVITPNNLMEPLAGDAGAHGVFEDRAKPFSAHLWANKHPNQLFAGAAVLGGAALLLRALGKRNGN